MRLPILMVFFIIGYILNLIPITRYIFLENVVPYLVFLLIVLAISYDIIQSYKRKKAIILIFIVSGIISLTISYVTYPIFRQVENWDIIFIFRFAPDVSISFFIL